MAVQPHLHIYFRSFSDPSRRIFVSRVRDRADIEVNPGSETVTERCGNVVQEFIYAFWIF